MVADSQYTRLFQKLRSCYSGARCGIFCNHTSYILQQRKYLVSALQNLVRLEKIFIPEHGFFAELQDQQPVSQMNGYDFLGTEAEIYSFYPGDEKLLKKGLEKLDQLDLLIIDIREVGSRYFTFVTMMGKIMEILKDRVVHLLIIDHPNPAGRWVEGIPLNRKYASLIGWPDLPHRYGLTLGELALFMMDQLRGKFHLEIIRKMDTSVDPSWIYPSPNIPHPLTARVYSGQCLWEGTNVSEGRGTTRPFEIFGAPFFEKLMTHWVDRWNRLHQEVILRPLIFVPTFHKYKGAYCYGFQLHPAAPGYHSLWYALQLIRQIGNELDEFSWREGLYESGSHRTAIELLAGDELLIDYLKGQANDQQVKEKLVIEEQKWIEHCSRFLLYPEPLQQGLK